jgi:predicted DNA-binding protein YlxM (UPF0122 family)
MESNKKVMTEEFKIIQEKLKIANKRTVKQILAHKELCSEIIKRDVISEHELIEEYEIPQNHLKGLKQQGKISFFTSTGDINKTKRGSKAYYFIDEIKDLFGYNIRYNKAFLLRNSLFSKMIVQISSKLLTERETEMLDMFLIKNISVDEIAEKYSISKVRASQVISKASRRMIGRIFMLQKMYANYNTALDYLTENALLKKQNKELYYKFLRNQQNQEIKDLKSNTNVQHFIKYGYDIKDLKMSYMDFDLSVRTLNCLKLAEIYTLDELLAYEKSDLLKFRNFGKKSLDELCDWLEDKYNWELK